MDTLPFAERSSDFTEEREIEGIAERETEGEAERETEGEVDPSSLFPLHLL